MIFFTEFFFFFKRFSITRHQHRQLMCSKYFCLTTARSSEKTEKAAKKINRWIRGFEIDVFNLFSLYRQIKRRHCDYCAKWSSPPRRYFTGEQKLGPTINFIRPRSRINVKLGKNIHRRRRTAESLWYKTTFSAVSATDRSDSPARSNIHTYINVHT